MRSASVERVERALQQAGHDGNIHELTVSTRTAVEAATALGVSMDQIAKSIVLESPENHRLFLFITSGSRRVDTVRARLLTGMDVRQAKPKTIRQ